MRQQESNNRDALQEMQIGILAAKEQSLGREEVARLFGPYQLTFRTNGSFFRYDG